MSALLLRVSLASLVLWATVPVSAPADEPKPRTDAFGDSLPASALNRLGTSRFRLEAMYGPMALSPDGKLLAAVSQRDTISLLDASTGLEVRRLKAEMASEQGSLAYSPDGRYLVVTGFLGEQVVDVNTGKAILRMERNAQAESRSISFSSAGKLLALGAEGGGTPLSVRVWNLETKKQLATLKPLHDAQVNACLSADGKLLATWGSSSHRLSGEKKKDFNQVIQLWDVIAGKELRQFVTEGSASLNNVAFSPDSKQLAVTGWDSSLSIWDVAAGKQLRRHAARSEAGAVLRYSPDGKRLLVGTRQGALQTWDAESGKRLDLSLGPNCLLSSITFVGQKSLAVGRQNQAVRLWETSSGRELTPKDQHTAGITALAFTSNSKTVISVADTVCWWDAASGKKLRQLMLYTSTERDSFGRSSVCVSPDGKYLSSAWQHQDGISLYDLESGEQLYRLPVVSNHNGAASAFADSSDVFAATGRDDSVKDFGTGTCVWDLTSGQEKCRLVGANSHASAVALSPDGKRVATANNSHDRVGNVSKIAEVQLWDVATGKETVKLAAEGWVTMLAFSLDGTVLATASPHQNSVQLWDVPSGTRLGQLRQNREDCCTLFRFSPDGRLLAQVVTSTNRPDRQESKVILWELASGKVRAEFSGHRGAMRAVAFAPDCRTLATGGDDTTVLLWDLVGKLDPMAGGASGKLTPQELANLWTELESNDAGKGHRAMVRLAVVPEQAVALLRQQVKPAPGKPLEAKEVESLLANLDSDTFKVREEASRALQTEGKSIRSAVVKALAGDPSPEKKRRLQELLDAMFATGPTPELVRPTRALEVLERLGTPEALQLVRELAGGNPNARLTGEANRVLRRLTPQP